MTATSASISLQDCFCRIKEAVDLKDFKLYYNPSGCSVCKKMTTVKEEEEENEKGEEEGKEEEARLETS